MDIKGYILDILLLLKFSSALAPSELVILILSQDNTYHQQLAKNIINDIHKQSILISKEHVINVHVVHEICSHPGEWTFLPVLPKLIASDIITSSTKWIILCEDQSLIRLKSLIDNLSQEDYTQEIYFGHPLYDQEATIIHHFAFFKNPRWFPYPMLHAGVIFSAPLVQRMADYVSKVKRKMDFSIDASHELARFIMEYVKPESYMHNVARSTTKDVKDVAGKGFVSHVAMRNGDSEPKKKANSKILMQPAPYICPVEGLRTDCALCVNSSATSSCIAINRDTIYFAIKTCHKFLKDRVPVIQKTWGQYTVHKRFFSDNASADVPTFATGVPNTETGHCLKTLSILKFALSDADQHNQQNPNKPIAWIFLSDDDTLLSVSGLCEILGCFDPASDVYLGERYGFRLHSEDGFNYITGGGGIAFSLSTVRKIVQSCTCPTISSPDDMILGSCLHGLNVKAIHSSRFHQARSVDYAKPLLTVQKPISFHKFWQIDPISVYEKWFAADDAKLLTQSSYTQQTNKISTENNVKPTTLTNRESTATTDHIEL